MEHKSGGHSEAANGRATQDAMVSKRVSVIEQALAGGTYTAKCVGPREEDRTRYCALRDKIFGYESRSFLTRDLWMMLFGIRKVREEIARIPLEEKWSDVIENVVTTVGKNYALDLILAASAYTVVGPYMGLINTNANLAVIGDTMASHATWLEVGLANDPDYTAPRKTITFSAAAAGSKASTGTYTFAMLNAGTVGGCFLVLHTGAVSTIDNTSGTLYSAGAFTGGSKIVGNGDSLTVTYTASL